QPPPSSTLSPYTTLFRSVHAAEQVDLECFVFGAVFLNEVDALEGVEQVGMKTQPVLRSARTQADAPHAGPEPRHGFAQAPLSVRDRKSTRLNSSHVKISY